MIKLLLIMILSLQIFSMDLKSLDNSNTNAEEKVIYKDMLSYLEQSNDPSQFLVLGSLYANGTHIKDSVGEAIPQDIYKAEKFLLKSYELGNVKALTILGGFVLLNSEMRKLDKDLSKTEKYLKVAYHSGEIPAGILLSNLYFTKEDYNLGQSTLMNCANKGNSEAQFAIALLYKDGLKNTKGKLVVNKNIKIAESYLNKACSNMHKSEKIKNICSNSNLVTTNIK